MTEYTRIEKYTVSCPRCGGSRTKKDGYQTGKQRYECNNCGKKFRDYQYLGKKVDLVDHKRFDAELIGEAIWDWYSGQSFKSIAQGLEFSEEIPEPSRKTIYEWVAEYTDEAVYATKDLKVPTSGHWVVDEMMVRAGGGWAYHWNIMDAETRYLLATHLSRGREARDGAKAFLKALQIADRPPDTVTTDDYIAYPRILREWTPNAHHIVSEGIREVINNNLSERMQKSYRSREKTLEGMDSLATGQRFLDGWTFNYNHIRDHWALRDQTPASVAGVKSPFREWADVVRAEIDMPDSARTKPTPRSEREVIEKDRRPKRRKAKTPRADMSKLSRMGKKKEGRQLSLIPKRMMPKIPKPQKTGRKRRSTRS